MGVCRNRRPSCATGIRTSRGRSHRRFARAAKRNAKTSDPMTTPIQQFEDEKRARIDSFGKDADFQRRSREWLEESMRKSYVYNFTWLGRPIIQNPIDIVAMQELIWRVQPDLIVETGIAHGGSLIFS